MRQRSLIIFAIAAVFVCAALAQNSKPAGVLSASDLQSVAPNSFFYRGQSANTQLRNTGGIRTAAGKYVLAGLVAPRVTRLMWRRSIRDFSSQK